MLLNSLFFFFAVGQAVGFQATPLQSSQLKGTRFTPTSALRASSNVTAVSDCPNGPNCTVINATITSLNVLGGEGCPAGTYHSQPLAPGSLDASVDFDNFYFNHTFSAHVNCTIAVDFEFTYPESGMPYILIWAISSIETKYGDASSDASFYMTMSWDLQAGGFAWEGGLGNEYFGGIAGDDGGSPPIFPVGTPGEVDTGTMEFTAEIWTAGGPGEFRVSKIAFGP